VQGTMGSMPSWCSLIVGMPASVSSAVLFRPVRARAVVLGDDLGEVLRGEPPHRMPNGRVDLKS
jgi:hypothetical protein